MPGMGFECAYVLQSAVLAAGAETDCAQKVTGREGRQSLRTTHVLRQIR
jgi:hypothetical protein